MPPTPPAFRAIRHRSMMAAAAADARDRPGSALFVTHELPGQGNSGTELIFAHGWGHSGAAMRPLAESLGQLGDELLIDFPGFGAAPVPATPWGTADYADATADLLTRRPRGRRLWIGHSFGCRVGLQLAARHPAAIDAMVLIAAAGLRPIRPPFDRIRRWTKIRAFKALKLLVPEGPRRDAWRARFGAQDYRLAGAMRPILTRVVNEDLTEEARKVACPTLIIVGRNDTETPPDMAERLVGLVPNARLVILDGFDHLSILTDGRHQAAYQITRFAREVLA